MIDRLRSFERRAAAWLRGTPILATHVAAIRRANGLRFTRWAAGIALFGYLSLFPLAVLAFLAFSALLKNFPEARAEAERALTDALTLNGALSTSGTVNLSEVAHATTRAGVVGVVGLLIAGLGWIDATLEGTRRMFGVLHRPRMWLLQRLEDAGWLLVLGSGLLAALVAWLGVTSAGTWVLDQLGRSVGRGVWLRVSGDGLAALMVFLVMVALYAFSCSRDRRSWRAIIKGALLATVGMLLLTDFAFLLVGRTLHNPVYGTLAVAAALLVLLYFGSAIVLYVACWIAVVEGAPTPTEVDAYYARRHGGAIGLPVRREARTHAEDGDRPD
ncbi:MAG TPA: YihY/virulence factor BrkB family protein [Actinomycetes bacterium]|nr:YihY/virulence factor BrkB family protein [Actinomycetes bacterium]